VAVYSIPHCIFVTCSRRSSRIADPRQRAVKLAVFLQQNGSADFSQASEMLDLPNGRCIYNADTRPDPEPRRGAAAA